MAGLLGLGFGFNAIPGLTMASLLLLTTVSAAFMTVLEQRLRTQFRPFELTAQALGRPLAGVLVSGAIVLCLRLTGNKDASRGHEHDAYHAVEDQRSFNDGVSKLQFVAVALLISVQQIMVWYCGLHLTQAETDLISTLVLLSWMMLLSRWLLETKYSRWHWVGMALVAVATLVASLGGLKFRDQVTLAWAVALALSNLLPGLVYAEFLIKTNSANPVWFAFKLFVTELCLGPFLSFFSLLPRPDTPALHVSDLPTFWSSAARCFIGQQLGNFTGPAQAALPPQLHAALSGEPVAAASAWDDIDAPCSRPWAVFIAYAVLHVVHRLALLGCIKVMSATNAMVAHCVAGPGRCVALQWVVLAGPLTEHGLSTNCLLALPLAVLGLMAYTLEEEEGPYTYSFATGGYPQLELPLPSLSATPSFLLEPDELAPREHRRSFWFGRARKAKKKSASPRAAPAAPSSSALLPGAQEIEYNPQYDPFDDLEAALAAEVRLHEEAARWQRQQRGSTGSIQSYDSDSPASAPSSPVGSPLYSAASSAAASPRSLSLQPYR